jgi:hypothetical protein
LLFARRPAGKPYEKFKEKDGRFLRTECCAMTMIFVVSTNKTVVKTKNRKNGVNDGAHGEADDDASGA